MPVFQVGNEPSKVVDINDPQGIVYNRSTTVQVFFGSSASLCNRADASILDPNATVAVDTDAEVWAVAPTLTGGNTVAVDYQPHGAAYFRGLTAGLGSLVLQSIFSPNFQHLVAGWSINKDGSAEFNNLTIRGTFFGVDFIINSSGIFLYNGTPALGNLVGSWAIASGSDSFGNAYRAGLNVDAVTGTSYLQLLPGNPALLNVGTGDTAEATPGQIAALVSGTGTGRIILTDLRAPRMTGENAGATAELQLQSPSADLTTSPPAVSLVSQDGVSAASGVTVSPAEVTLTTILAMFTGVAQMSGTGIVPATPPSNAIKWYADANSGNGHLKYVSSDGIDYATGRVTVHASNGGAGQTINSVTFTTIGGLTAAVAATIYRFRIEVDLTAAAAAGQWELQLSGPTVSSIDYRFFWEGGAGATAGAVNQTSLTATQKGPNPSVIGPYTAVYAGFVRFSAAGTLSVQAATTVATDTFTVWDASVLKLEPLV